MCCSSSKKLETFLLPCSHLSRRFQLRFLSRNRTNTRHRYRYTTTRHYFHILSSLDRDHQLQQSLFRSVFHVPYYNYLEMIIVEASVPGVDYIEDGALSPPDSIHDATIVARVALTARWPITQLIGAHSPRAF